MQTFTYHSSEGQRFQLTPEMGTLALPKNQPIGQFTILWITMGECILDVEQIPLHLTTSMMTFFTPNQVVQSLNHEGEYVALQFNHDFYCTFQHQVAISCNGVLFYGSKGIPVIQLGAEDNLKFERLYHTFLEEFAWRDKLQGSMLRTLLKQWIITAIRIYNMQEVTLAYDDPNLEVIRHFNMLVEERFKELHTVAEYAHILHKSPKTLSNLFRQYMQDSPLSIIHSRIALEAKRLLLYTDKNITEIAYELGFDTATTFSRLFKRSIGHSPQAYRELHYK